MNKRMIVLIALVVAVFVVPASAETLEVRGGVVDLDYGAQNMDLVWNATNFGAFWYDLDDDLMTEELTIAAGTLSIPWDDRTIDTGNLTYTTTLVPQQYKVYTAKGVTVGGASQYYAEGWAGKKHVAIDGDATKITKLLVEQNSSETKRLKTGEDWVLGGGFNLTPTDINSSAFTVQLQLSKDGDVIDIQTINFAGSDQERVYVYSSDLAGEGNVPIVTTYVSPFGMDMVRLKYTWAISDNATTIATGDEFGVMRVMTANSLEIILKNNVSIDLSAGNIEQIIDNMYFKTADNDDPGEDNRIRFYPFVEYTEPGTYEIRGTVQDFDGPQTETIEWSATNFAAFWYDIDENLMTESLYIKANSLDGDPTGGHRTIEEDDLIYHTQPVPQAYELYEDGGMQLESGVDNRTHYFVEGWLAEKYVALNGQADTLVKLLVEFKGDDNETLVEYKPWNMTGGFALDAQIGLEGTNVLLVLSKNGSELDSEVVSAGEVYTYTTNIGGESNVPVFSCYVDAIYRENNTIRIKYVFLTDNEVLEINSGDEFGIMEADATTNYINLINEEDTVDLSQDNKEHIMGNIYFRTADNGGTGEDNRLRFYPFVERTIGGEEPTPKPGTISDTDSDHDGVPDVWDADNSTQEGYWVNQQGIGRMLGDMNGDGKLTSADALMILQAAVGTINL